MPPGKRAIKEADMESIIQIAGSLGVGAFLATIIFLMYRRDRLNTETMWRESKKFTEDRLTELIEKDQESREDNTRAVTELVTLLIRMNGQKK